MQGWARQPTRCVLRSLQQFRLSSSSRISIPHRDPRPSPGFTGPFNSGHHLRNASTHSRGSKSRKDEKESRARGKTYNGKPTSRDYESRHEFLDQDIKNALSTLRKRMEEKEADLIPRSVLDPHKRLWEKYCKQVTALRGEASAGDSRAKNKWTLLLRANDKQRPKLSVMSDLETELYIGWLDYALKPDQTKADSSLIDIRYPTEWYSRARAFQRVIHLHVGPTNSGKTYTALKRLREAGNGFYAGPLRLLAHEVYSRFRANGIPCDLITGDDIRFDQDGETKVYASTVEMVNTSKVVEVAVLDEIQMMGSEDRGWAWTRAFLGANAKEVHLCGESRVIPMIRELAASMGDTLHIHHYQRLNPLRCMSKSLRGNLKLLRKGDCIVAFSVMHIHALKKQIELETGRRCAIVYGSLPPETRATQADLFNDPDNDYDYLVASDAIGMGLNLSIKRIIFSGLTKFDGMKRTQIPVPQIKQIAGRAGRFRTSRQDKSEKGGTTPTETTEGLVTCLDEADLPIIRQAMNTEPPPLMKAGLLPPTEYLEDYAAKLPFSVPFEFLMRRVAHEAELHPRFFMCDLRDKLDLARITDSVQGLTIEQRTQITAAPSPGRNAVLGRCLKRIAEAIANNEQVTVADLKDIPLEILNEQPKPDRAYLESLEDLHKSLILFLWLSYRFTLHLRDQPMAVHAKDLTEQRISWTLKNFSANPRLRAALAKMRNAPEIENHEGLDTPEAGDVALSNEIGHGSNASIPHEVFDSPGHVRTEAGEQFLRLESEEETVGEHFAEPATVEAHRSA